MYVVVTRFKIVFTLSLRLCIGCGMMVGAEEAAAATCLLSLTLTHDDDDDDDDDESGNHSLCRVA